jgi:hypothetical protein
MDSTHLIRASSSKQPTDAPQNRIRLRSQWAAVQYLLIGQFKDQLGCRENRKSHSVELSLALTRW